MKKYRYPGAPPFSYEDRKLFYGRDDDIGRFYKFVNIEELVVLYSRSGLGKSSMLNAGVVPKLIAESNFQPYSVKFSSYGEESTTSPVDVVASEIKQGAGKKTFLDKIIKPDNSLWYHLKSHHIATKCEKDYFLIFDQFENLFSFPSKGERDFGQQLADLLHVTIPQKYRDALEKKLSEDPDFLSGEELKLLYKPFKAHIVIAIRSDKMSLLNRLKVSLPYILNKTIMLDALNRSQAEDAIIYPAYVKGEYFSTPFDYSDEALDKILKFLSKNDERKIESFQLQILCQYIEENIVIGQNKKYIEAGDLGDIAAIFRNYYDNIIEKLPVEEHRKARVLIEEGLIFEEDMRRLNLYEGQIFKKYEISENTLQELVNKRLLRREPIVSGGFSYELSHDTLVAPILRAKSKRIQAEEAAAAEIEKLKRKEIEHKEAARRRRRRTVIGAIVVTYLLLVTVGAIWLIYNWRVISTQKKQLTDQNKTLELQSQVQDSLNESLSQSYERLSMSENELSASNELLQHNADALRKKNEELETTTNTLRESEAALSEAVITAKEAELNAYNHLLIAETRFEDLQARIGSQLMEKANEEAAEKNYNAAKIYALYAFLVNEYLTETTYKEALKYASQDDYPLNILTPQYTQKLKFVSFSPDEKTFATIGKGSESVLLWNVTDRTEKVTLPKHKNEVNCFSFSPDGKSIASGSQDREIVISNAETGEKLHVFNAKGNSVTTLVYSPDNNLLISVSNNYLTHTITFYETKNYQEVNSFQGGTSGINNLAFGREGDIVAWIDADNVIKIYDIAKERVIQELKGHSGKVNCLSFNASGELLASGADDNNIVIWDAVTGRIVGTLEGHDGNVISIAFGPKDNQLASGDDNSIIKLWKITPELFRFQDNTSNISQTSIGQALNKDEQTVRKPDSKSTQYNASDTMLIATLKNHLSGVVSLTFLEGGNMLASFGLEDRSVKLWDLSQNNKIRHASIDTAFTKKAIARAENSFNLELEGTIIKIKATEFELLYQKGNLAFESSEKIRIYSDILKSNPYEADALLGIADAYFDLPDYFNAVKYYTDYLYLRPGDYDGWVYLGASYYGQRDYNNAMEIFSKAIGLNPDDFLAWHYRGLTYMGLGDPQNARNDYLKSAELNPNSNGVWNHIGNTYYYEADYNNAIESYKKETIQNPTYKWAWLNMGSTYNKLENINSAIESYNKALDLDPYFIEVLDSISRIYLKQKDYVRSYEAVINILEQSSDEGMYWYFLATIALYGNVDDAIDFIDYIFENNLDFYKDSFLWNAKGLAHFKKKEYEDAIFYYKKALDMDPSDITTNINMAFAYSHYGQRNLANDYYQKVIAFLPGSVLNADDFNTRAFAWLSLGDKKKAFADLQKAGKLDENHERVYRTWACYYADSNIDKTFNSLETAYNLGYVDYLWIEEEPLINGIRSDSRFQTYINKLKLKKGEIAEAQKLLYTRFWIMVLGDRASSRGDYYTAVKFYRDAFELNPDNVTLKTNYTETLSKLGKQSLDKNDFTSAYQYYVELWQIDNTYYSAFDWNEAGNRFYNNAHYEKSIEFYLHALAMDKNYKWAWGNLGGSYWGLYDTTKAIDAYRHSLESDESYLFSLNGLGIVYKSIGAYDSSVYYFNKALKVDPYYKWAWRNLGLAYSDMGNVDKAISAYKMALVSDNMYTDVYNRLGIIYKSKKPNYDSAIYYFSKAVEIDPAYIYSWANLGDVYSSEKNVRLSIDAYEKSLEIKPDYTYSLNRLGYLYFTKNSYDSAIYFLDKALLTNSNYKWSWKNLGDVLYAKGDTAASIEPYKKAIEIDPSYYDPLTMLAYIYGDFHNYDSALYYAELQASYYPKDSNIWGSLSWYYLFVGKYKEALHASVTGYDLNNDNTWILTNKGHALLFLGNFDEAREVYLELKDDDSLKESLLKDFDDFEKAGIRNENFDVIRTLINE